MVHATVERGKNGSFTVTFGEVTTLNNQKAVPVAASGSKSATMPGATSALSSDLSASKPISGVSSGTNQLDIAKATWKGVVEEVNKDIQAVSANASTDPQRAREEAGKLSTKLTTAYKVIESLVKNEEKPALSAEKKSVADKISSVIITAQKALKKKKGGRRTRRKRTHRKRTHRKRK
jgi:hypothetical protein